ncbi:MAG TPA: DNA adenine methylase, partial [Xenococcaceae cyanobacterium]
MRSHQLAIEEIDRNVKAKPFVKWVGGKTQLLSELKLRIPSSFSRYFEPFIGGGALFFQLQPKQSILIDL